MHNNKLFLMLLAVLVLLSIWYTTDAIQRTFEYKNLSAKAKIEEVNWSVKQLGSDRFIPVGHYQFNANQTSFSGESELSSPIYRNAWSIEQSFSDLSDQHVFVWYNPKDPSHNSLQKRFPRRECVSAFVLWAIFLYFLGLGYYVGKRQNG